MHLKITSIDATPNPNSIKISVDTPVGSAGTYAKGKEAGCPTPLQPILGIPGVMSVFATAKFFTITRDPAVAWDGIVKQVQAHFPGA